MEWVMVLGCGCFLVSAVFLNLGHRVFCLKHKRFEEVVFISQTRKEDKMTKQNDAFTVSSNGKIGPQNCTNLNFSKPRRGDVNKVTVTPG